MKNNYLQNALNTALCLLLTVSYVTAQDTIIVQTFDWNSNTRSDIFTFPDEPGQTFSKILMKYNLRCHDAAVGSGNVGCREWDYSCNTFITDPSIVDSTYVTHPSHLISNFSGAVFPYTTQAVYDYFQYGQQFTTATSIMEEQVGTLGMPDLESALMAPSLGRKSQFLYTAAELQNAGLTAGPIEALELTNLAASDPVNFLQIRMKATVASELQENQVETSGFQELYNRNTAFDLAGLQRLYFNQAFDWDGTSNILVEFSYSNTEGTQSNKLAAYEESGASSLVGQNADKAAFFNGAGTVEINPATFEDVSEEITISFWSYGLPDNLPVNTTVFEGTDANNQRQLNVHLPWGNSSIYWDCGNDGSGYDRIEKAANPADFEGQWNHWAFTKNATTGIMQIYLNGELWHSGTGKTRTIGAMESFVLGHSVNGNNPYYGKIDDFTIWKKALDQSTISSWMYRTINADHPFYSELVALYNFDEASGMDSSPNGNDATLVAAPGFPYLRGHEVFKNLQLEQIRPMLGFVQGTFVTNTSTETVLDSTIQTQRIVAPFSVNGNNELQAEPVEYYWEAVPSTIIQVATGDTIGIVENEAEGQIDISTLEYYPKRPAKLELVSFVTPYGNGLNLGQEGKTWFFDVTDYMPVLRGDKRISIEMGGEWQEEMDIEFWFITGTPPRDVLGIENVWPFQRGWYGQIQQDEVFEARTLRFNPDGAAFKVRTSITGHGQNGEFVPREHYLNINGGAQEFAFDVWKECGYNPVYPQGGTWIFDRAGWCPGMATDVHEFDITDWALGAPLATLDYGLNEAFLEEANYLVSTQLVTYGAPNFETDAAITAIIRPSDNIEYGRLNPVCNIPLIEVQNTGASPLTQLTITYQVTGGPVLTKEWEGNLAFLEKIVITLPVETLSFWSTQEANPRFEVQLTQINNFAMDEVAYNNHQSSSFDPPLVLDFDNLQLQTRTNNRASENRFSIIDYSGNVLLERDEMENNTTYKDVIDFAPGCYSLIFEDDGDDGLQFWYWATIGEDVGTGSLRFERQVLPTVALPIHHFNADFGGGLQFDFVIPETTTTVNREVSERLSVYPNPTPGPLTLEWQGQQSGTFNLLIYNTMGKLMHQQQIEHYSGLGTKEELDLSNLPAGIYYLQVQSDQKMWVTEVVKL